MNDLGNHGREKVVPPVPRQAQVRQLACQRAHRLVRMARAKETLELQLGMPPDNLGDLPDGALRKPAGCLKGKRLGTKAELKHQLLALRLELGQEQLIHVRRVTV